MKISTHSLTRRLTVKNYSWTDAKIISTHSLTRRLTLRRYKQIVRQDISTHSLTRRLTTAGRINLKNLDFNSQPHKEADGKNRYYMCETEYFNSQPHKEAVS